MSESNNTGSENQTKEREININEVISFFLSYKKRIIIVIMLSATIGVLWAIFSKNEYTAQTSFIPQFSSGQGLAGGFSGLASIAGINLSGGGQDNVILPAVYPKIISSIGFRLELSKAKVVLNVASSDSITYSDYYANHFEPGVLSNVKKYTIGLPFVLLNALKGDPSESVEVNGQYSFLKLSRLESEDAERVLSQLVVQHNERNGYVSLFYKMDDPFLAAQMAEHGKNLLQDMLINLKIKNAELQLNFIKERYDEKKKEFLAIEMKLAKFLDTNQNLTSQLAINRQNHLESEYNVVLGVYTELAKQLEQAKIQVAKDTPVFSIIEPVSIPLEKSAPKRSLMVVVFTIVGTFFMMIYILIKFVRRQNILNFS